MSKVEGSQTRKADVVTSDWWTWAWVTPIAAIAIAGWLVYRSIPERGPTITLSAERTEGIEPARTLVKHRGVTVGKVTDVRLGHSPSGVEVDVRLMGKSEAFAREGAGFWIVRPELRLDEVRGLQTIVSGPYIEATPGDGEPQSEFEMWDEPPLAGVGPGDLEVILIATHKHALSRGTSMTYRGVPIGVVQSVDLSQDGVNVEIDAVVYERYARLVRADSVFWNSGGLDLEFDLLSGAKLSIDSLRSVVSGSISMATPTEFGPPTGAGQRFVLLDEPDEGWESWAPRIPLGGETSPESLGAGGSREEASEVPSVGRADTSRNARERR